MIWQDLVISIGQFVFIISMIPSILSQYKPDIKTSLPTGLILMVFTISFLSMGMYMASISSFLTSVCWLILFYQKLK